MAKFDRQRSLVRRLVETRFQHAWAWRVEIEDQPQDFELYVKDMSYGPVELGTDQIKVGTNVLTYPNSVEPVSVSMTMRDNEDGRIYSWLNDWAGRVVNGDGTVNPPRHPQKGYLKRWKRYQVKMTNDGRPEDVPSHEWLVYPTQMGDIAESYSEHGFLEFPITFMQFRS